MWLYDKDPDLDGLGRLLFGRGLRLRLALWIFDAGRDIYLTECMDAMPSRYRSAVSQELERLVEIGLIEPVLRAESRRKYFSRTQSPLWAVFETARIAAVGGPAIVPTLHRG